MVTKPNYIISLLLVVITLSVFVNNVNGAAPGLDCQTSDAYSRESKFLRFFDECFLDTSDVNAWGSIATQFQSWFNEQSYPIYVSVIIIVITLLFFAESVSDEDAARGNCVRLQAIVMVARLGLVISMIPWLWASLSQDRPCVCKVPGTETFVPLIPIWGMPSGASFAGTVIAAHVSQYLNIPLGIIFGLLACASALVTGQYSTGQVVVGILFGAAIYVYTSRTPIFMRAADLIMTIIAGVIALFVTKSQYQQLDFSFAVLFLIGIAWQLYSLVLVLVTYDMDFIRVAIKRSSHNLHAVDFMYYKPLNSNPASHEKASQYPHEAMWITVATAVLFAVLCGLSISTQYIDSMLAV